MAKLELGDGVPNVSGLDQDGRPIEIGEYCGDGYCLVFFYPKAETPGCIAQACSLRDGFADLQARGVKVLGVSSDGVPAQKRFHENRSLPYPLIADSEKRVIDAFGVPSKLGLFLSRRAYLFKSGKLVWIDEGTTAEQAAKALEAVARIDAANT